MYLVHYLHNQSSIINKLHTAAAESLLRKVVWVAYCVGFLPKKLWEVFLAFQLRVDFLGKNSILKAAVSAPKDHFDIGQYLWLVNLFHLQIGQQDPDYLVKAIIQAFCLLLLVKLVFLN